MRFAAAITVSALVAISMAVSVPDVKLRAVEAEDVATTDPNNAQADVDLAVASGTCPVANNGGCGSKACWCRDKSFKFPYAPCYPNCGCPDGWTGWCH